MEVLIVLVVCGVIAVTISRAGIKANKEQARSFADKLVTLLNSNSMQKDCKLAKCSKFNQELKARIERYAKQAEPSQKSNRENIYNPRGKKKFSHDLLVEVLVILKYFRAMQDITHPSGMSADKVAKEFVKHVNEAFAELDDAHADPFVPYDDIKQGAKFNFSAELETYSSEYGNFFMASNCDPFLNTPKGFDGIHDWFFSLSNSSYRHFGKSFDNDVVSVSKISKSLARSVEADRLKSHQDIEAIILGFLLTTLVAPSDSRRLKVKWVDRRAYTPRQLNERPIT